MTPWRKHSSEGRGLQNPTEPEAWELAAHICCIFARSAFELPWGSCLHPSSSSRHAWCLCRCFRRGSFDQIL